MRRKPILLSVVAGMFLANLITAFVDIFAITLVARFVAGAVLRSAVGHARRLYPKDRPTGQDRQSAGDCDAGGYHDCLLHRYAAGDLPRINARLAMGIRDLGNVRRCSDRMDCRCRSRRARTAAANPHTPASGVHGPGSGGDILLVVFGWFFAHNMLYTYIAPFLASVDAGLRFDVVLLIFGVSSLAGIVLTGTVIDRALRKMVLASLTAFATGTLALGIAGGNSLVLMAAVVLWGETFAGASTLLQTALADATGPDADVANSMLTVAANLAIFGAGATGGVLLDTAGPQLFPWVALVIIAVIFRIALLAPDETQSFQVDAWTEWNRRRRSNPHRPNTNNTRRDRGEDYDCTHGVDHVGGKCAHLHLS